MLIFIIIAVMTQTLLSMNSKTPASVEKFIRYKKHVPLLKALNNKTLTEESLTTFLQDSSIDPNYVSPYARNKQPLLNRFLEGNMPVGLVRLLLDYKADPNRQTEDGKTPLNVLMEFKYSLLPVADNNTEKKIRYTQQDKLELIALFNEAGARWDIQDNEGKTALFNVDLHAAEDQLIFTDNFVTTLNTGIQDKVGNTIFHHFVHKKPMSMCVLTIMHKLIAANPKALSALDNIKYNAFDHFYLEYQHEEPTHPLTRKFLSVLLKAGAWFHALTRSYVREIEFEKNEFTSIISDHDKKRFYFFSALEQAKKNPANAWNIFVKSRPMPLAISFLTHDQDDNTLVHHLIQWREIRFLFNVFPLNTKVTFWKNKDRKTPIDQGLFVELVIHYTRAENNISCT